MSEELSLKVQYICTTDVSEQIAEKIILCSQEQFISKVSSWLGLKENTEISIFKLVGKKPDEIKVQIAVHELRNCMKVEVMPRGVVCRPPLMKIKLTMPVDSEVEQPYLTNSILSKLQSNIPFNDKERALILLKINNLEKKLQEQTIPNERISKGTEFEIKEAVNAGFVYGKSTQYSYFEAEKAMLRSMQNDYLMFRIPAQPNISDSEMFQIPVSMASDDCLMDTQNEVFGIDKRPLS